jgi:FMNH2-dependent dimethyl sulfone monooxygenase
LARSSGDPDHVAHELKTLHNAGFDGVAIGFVNYLDELPFFVQEVVPWQQARGLRRSGCPA